MHRLRLFYDWASEPPSSDLRPNLGNALLDALQAVQEHGSISGAARAMGLSYRHLWGQLKKWETSLERPLVNWEKGQAARLTPFATKLLWAERLAQARFGPQIESLQSELHRSFAMAFDDSVAHLRLHASHDEGLSLLRQYTAGHHQLHLEIRFEGSVDAVRALRQRRTAWAGFHVRKRLIGGSSTGERVIAGLGQQMFLGLLQDERHQLIGFATRRQGLMVSADNPHKISDLPTAIAEKNPPLRFALRASGTGTRLLLQELLQEQGLQEPSHWQQMEPEVSHAAVAQAVASGIADVGLGIEAAAASQGLGFIPLALENYFLVVDQAQMEEPGTKALLSALQDPAFQAQLNALPGYQAHRCGELLPLRATLEQG